MRYIVIISLLLLSGCEKRTETTMQQELQRQGSVKIVGTYGGQPLEAVIQYQGQENVEGKASSTEKTSNMLTGFMAQMKPLVMGLTSGAGSSALGMLTGGTGTALLGALALFANNRRKKAQEQRRAREEKLANLPPEVAKEAI